MAGALWAGSRRSVRAPPNQSVRKLAASIEMQHVQGAYEDLTRLAQLPDIAELVLARKFFGECPQPVGPFRADR